MEVKARAKINLSLDVTGTRADGYHMVRMVMQMVDVTDTLTFEKTTSPGISLTTNDPKIPTDGRNLIWKAAELLMKEFDIREGLKVHLDKHIPSAAGLAGGSSDAAQTMLAVNEMFELGLSAEELCRRAVRLGADIPYCILGGTALSEGIGEILTPLPAIPDCIVVLAKPDIDVSTKYVYEHFDAAENVRHPDVDAQLAAINRGDLDGIVDSMGNVLAEVTVPEHPIIEEIRQVMLSGGAIGAMMSGSGPTVFGIFDEKEKAEAAASEIESRGLSGEVFVTRPYNMK